MDQQKGSSGSTDHASATPFGVAAPQLTLPKGGGAIRGIGEKFSANPVTGTGSMSVPIFTSPGRSGFGPQLTVSYDSGAGNGPFGLGWHLSLPSITRKTDKGLPQYEDRGESDVYLLSGAEDLVPVLTDDATAMLNAPTRQVATATYAIRHYRPRIEGLFARIERWTNQKDPTDVFWRSISKDNITTSYGKMPESRIFDPDDRSRIFSWLICESYDDKGNVVCYGYKPEDSNNIDLSAAHERNRADTGRTSNRYLKRVRYGNRLPYVPKLSATDPWPAPPGATAVDGSQDWLFEVVFDFGDHDDTSPLPTESLPWTRRNDPFSSYRSTFEIRTYRLCQRVLMFHHFAGEPGVDTNCLVRSTDFEYSYEADPANVANPIFSFLRSVSQTGYKRAAEGGYSQRSTPPVEFEYSQPVIDTQIHDVDPKSLENLPYGLAGTQYQWVDLDGEGLSGILTAQAGAWFYKRNLSPISPAPSDYKAGIKAAFGPLEVLARQPAPILQGTAHQQLLDLAGDGQLDLAEFDGPAPGYYQRTEDQSWEALKTFQSLPVLDWSDPNLKFIDLTGDGHADILISEDSAFCWHASLAEAGFGAAQRVLKRFDEEKGPAIIFADGTQTIFLADMSGDGLTDLVRVRNGEVCYWPNLGYGNFGAKVTMDNAPWFEAPDLFDGRRVHLADIDGSGVTDIIYLGSDGIQLYFNQSGNSWSARYTLSEFPLIDNVASVTALDLLGNGTTCLVWSSPLPGEARRALRYIDLIGGQKPHLLVKTINNLGAEATVDYVPSTQFYLADKLAGTPWITRLPFVVHCVQRVSVHDKWRNTTFSSTYRYHHGYFDGVEREFRGFGRVEQVDVEDFGIFSAANAASPYVTPDKALYQPPVKTVTWFHTGVFIDAQRVLSHYAEEYFPHGFDVGGFTEAGLPEPDLAEADLSADEWREALRACKGMVLRQEIYELDVDALTQGIQRPVKLFSTAYHNCHIDRLQRQGINKFAVFLVTESEALTYHYELDLTAARATPDPRVAHTLNLETDEFGHVLQSVAVAYPRLGPFSDPTLPQGGEQLVREVQDELHLAFTQSSYTDKVDEADNYRVPLPWQVKTYEVTGLRPTGYFSLAELRSYQLGDPPFGPGRINPVQEIPYHQIPDGSVQQRLVEQVRTIYFSDDLTPLSVGRLGRLGLKYEDYKLALTDQLLTDVFGAKLNESIAGDTAAKHLTNASTSGYLNGSDLAARFAPLDTTGQYWMRSGIAGFKADAAQHFYLPERYTDSFGNVTGVNFDQKYDLFVQSVVDHRGNTTSVEDFDFRVLSPRRMKDPNGNLSEVAFDRLGMPAAMALLGKGTEGDSFDGLSDAVLNPPAAEVRRFFTSSYKDVSQAPHNWLATATARHVYWFGEELNPDGSIAWEKHPPAACGIMREKHVASLSAGEASPLQVAIEYSDGLGSVLVKKAQAEPDPTSTETTPPLRWIASGKTVLNNKGKPVKQYEPYFSDTEHRFDETEAQREVGVTPVMYYDAVGRLIHTDSPDGSYSRIEFDPWQVMTWDQNDTVLDSTWYSDRNPLDFTTPLPTDPITNQITATADQRAAWLAARCSGTPSVTFLDSMGRSVITVAHNRVEDAIGTFVHGGKKYRDDKYLTFTRLDAESKPLWIRDARGNLVMQYIAPAKTNNDPSNEIPAGTVPCYDIAGNLLFQHSMDAGDRWMITDAVGKPMLAWDFNERQTDTGLINEARLYFTAYDELHRPIAQWLSINGQPEQMMERFDYRDASDNDASALQNNLQGQLVRHYDPSGLAETARRDFKGNVEIVQRNLVSDATASLVDWQTVMNPDGSSKLTAETFTQITQHDALNRMTRLYNWHRGTGSRVAVYDPDYSERGALDAEHLVVRTTKTATDFDHSAGTAVQAIQDVRYNPKGQKELLQLGNGTVTGYSYDPNTFRLTNILTTRPIPAADQCSSAFNDARVIQDLRYTYDPVGNIMQIVDAAQATTYGNNQKIAPVNLYEYDAIYRLTSATGRESGAANGAPTQLEGQPPTFDCPAPDPARLRNYMQTFAYDPVGNIDRVRHSAGSGSWTRDYVYAFEDPSQPASNRLWQTWVGGDLTNAITYDHDTHGNMLNLANAAVQFNMIWDHRDMIASIDLGGGGTAYYQYDAGKQRTRKRIDNQNDLGGYWERIDLGGYELYRRFNAGSSEVIEEIESLHLFEGEQRVLLVDDVITAGVGPGPDGLTVKAQTLFRYQYSNHLGSACLELDDQAEIISYEEFHPYGTSAYCAGKSGIETPPKRYRYTGMERDEESRLSYHGARHYASWTGRWLSSDRIPSVNVYVYCASNPIVFADFDGHNPSAANDYAVDAGAVQVGAADLKTRSFIFTPSEVREMIRDTAPYPEGTIADADLFYSLDWVQTKNRSSEYQSYGDYPKIYYKKRYPKLEEIPVEEKQKPPVENQREKRVEEQKKRPEETKKTLGGKKTKSEKKKIEEKKARPEEKSKATTTISPIAKPAPSAPPPTYTARNIQFRGTNWAGPYIAEFLNDSYVSDIDKVADILRADSSLHVTIEASVGFGGVKEYIDPSLTGRGPEVYAQQGVGETMDARAKKVQEELIQRGISIDRITLSRGAAYRGEESRKVEFHFGRE